MFVNPHFFLSKCQYGHKNTLVFLLNLYSVIPKSNELCIHQVPLVTLFFTIYFRSIMMKRRPANHARSSIFFKLKRNSPFLLHPKKVCLYFAYNSKSVCNWTVWESRGTMLCMWEGKRAPLTPHTNASARWGFSDKARQMNSLF